MKFFINIFYILISLVWVTTYGQIPSATSLKSAEDIKDERELHFTLAMDYYSIKLAGISLSEAAIRPGIEFFPSNGLSLDMGYFSVIDTSGSSNLDGFDFGVKYYPFGAGTKTIQNLNGFVIKTRPKHAFWGGLYYLTRNVRYNSQFFYYSGFMPCLGYEWHYSPQYFFGAKVGSATLKNSIGSSTNKNMTVTSLAVYLGTSF